MIARILFNYFKIRQLERYLTTPARLQSYQLKKLNLLKKNALSKSPLYQPFLNKPFEEWPIMNKKTMMANFNEINTAGIDKTQALEIASQAEASRNFSPMLQGDIAVGLSSGTSGHRGLFLASPAERDFWAGMILAKAMPKGILGKERIAFFLRANNRLYTTLNKSKNIQFYFFDLVDDFEKHLAQLNQIQPTILSAPASVLRLLALNHEQLTIQPKKIFSVAEVLEQDDAHLIERQFGVPVSQIYQCTEGLLAMSHRKTNRLLMQDDCLIIEKEWLDEKRFVPIITDLNRFTQPIIRYRLDDVLVSKPSSHIFTELERIEGRLGDVCYAQRGNEKVPLFADVLRQQMINSKTEFEDYRITQTSLIDFAIQVTPEPIHKDQLTTHLNQLFVRRNLNCPNWHWQPYEKRPAGDKRRRILSNI